MIQFDYLSHAGAEITFVWTDDMRAQWFQKPCQQQRVNHRGRGGVITAFRLFGWHMVRAQKDGLTHAVITTKEIRRVGTSWINRRRHFLNELWMRRRQQCSGEDRLIMRDNIFFILHFLCIPPSEWLPSPAPSPSDIFFFFPENSFPLIERWVTESARCFVRLDVAWHCLAPIRTRTFHSRYLLK